MTTPDPTSAAGTTARELIAHLIWDHLDTGSNDRDRTIAEHQADEIMAMLHANGLRIAGPGEVVVSRDEFNRLAVVVRDSYQRSIGNKTYDRLRRPALDAAMETILAASARAAGEEK